MREPAAVIGSQPVFLHRHHHLIEPRRLLHARRLRRFLVAVVVVLLALWVAYVAFAVVRAAHDLQAGKRSLQAARGKTTTSDVEHSTAVPALLDAAVHLGAAHHKLSSSLLGPAKFLPVIGRQLRSADDLSASGARASSAVAEALKQVGTARAAVGSDGRVALLRKLLGIGVTTRQHLSNLNLGPRRGLMTPLADARNTLAGELDQATSALDRAISGGQSLLDTVSGSHRVLLLLTNNAEMRAGSGMANQVGLLTITDGQFSLDQVRPVDQVPIPQGAVPVTGDMAARWSWVNPTGDWQELLASPRFDQTAPLASQMWTAAGNAPVDAVMAVDPVALQDLLNVLGPVTVNGRLIGPANVVLDLEHDQYERLPLPSEGVQRHDDLSDVARASIESLQNGAWSPTRLGLGLADAVHGRHLLLWSSNPTDEKGWVAAGASGQLTSISVEVSILNRGRNKLDHYLYVGAGLTPRRTADGTQFDMSMVLDNRTPPTEVASVAGPGAGVQSVVQPGQTVNAGDYVGIVAVSLPGGATDVAIDGTPAPQVLGPDGPTFVVGNQYIVPAGSTQVVTLHFRLPNRSGALRLEPPARIPQLFWKYNGRIVQGDGTHVITW